MYQRSEAEISFIIRTCKLQDLRKIGCPDHIFDAIVEDRATKIAGQLAEFRAKQATEPETPAPSTIETQIASAKLW